MSEEVILGNAAKPEKRPPDVAVADRAASAGTSRSIVPRRLAFADLLFSWPPNGGADADLYHVLDGLQAAGHEVHLFGAHEEGSTDRGRFSPDLLPFPATRLSFSRRSLTPQRISATFRQAIDAWQPDLVFIMHGFALKPYLMKALSHYPTVARYYAHELACARNPLRYKDERPCPQDYLRAPDICRRCALHYQREAIQHRRHSTWTVDYLAAKAFKPKYHATVLEALAGTTAVIVSNSALKAHLEGFHNTVFVAPGGVHAANVIAQPPLPKGPAECKIILMTGRADDPLKGLDVLLEAGRLLEKKRQDFEIWATHFDHTLSAGWFKALGWMDYAATLALYPRADVCVVPSLWEEPFGLVAVEAMAAERPVCASRTGGLAEIVRHTETGFLFTPGDSAELAKELDLLLDNPPLRIRMGQAGRRIVEDHYDWKHIITRHYLPIIERLLP